MFRIEYRLNVVIAALAIALIMFAMFLNISVDLRNALLTTATILIAISFIAQVLPKNSKNTAVKPAWKLNPDDFQEAIILTDLNGKLLVSNSSAKTLIDFCPTCTNIKELFHEWHKTLPNSTQAQDVVDAVLSAPDLQFSETLYFSDGKVVERSTRPLDNQLVRIWCMRDVSQLHQASNDSQMHTTMVEEDAARTAELAEQLFHAKAELEEKQTELTRLANTDSLTGLWNRRKFTSMGKEAITQTKTDNIWVLMMDIDHFKRVNDTYGHAAGDVAIRDFANISTQTIGDNGFVGRMGGEEFAVILENTELSTAVRLAEEIRQNTANHVTISDSEKLRFTCSIGIAQWNKGEISIEAALDRADQALYSAKSFGRNRVVGYEFS